MKFFSFAVLSALVASPALAHVIDVEGRALTPPCPDNKLAKTLHRLYNPKTQDHIYTTDEKEVEKATKHDGYIAGTSAGSIFTTQVARTTPFYRLHNIKKTDHFYTTSAFVKGFALKAGYHDEGIAGYIFTDGFCPETAILYGLYNPEQTDHLYTQIYNERKQARAAGFVDDGFAGYVIGSSGI